MREPKFKLTPAGFCSNPACGRQLYLDLMTAPWDEVCDECDRRPAERDTPTPHDHCAEAYCATTAAERQEFLSQIGMVACEACGAGMSEPAMARTPTGYRCRGRCAA
jgi:hypothetical protein